MLKLTIAILTCAALGGCAFMGHVNEGIQCYSTGAWDPVTGRYVQPARPSDARCSYWFAR